MGLTARLEYWMSFCRFMVCHMVLGSGPSGLHTWTAKTTEFRRGLSSNTALDGRVREDAAVEWRSPSMRTAGKAAHAWRRLLQLIDTKMCAKGCKSDAITSGALQSPNKREKGNSLLLSPVGQIVADQLAYVAVDDREVKLLYATRREVSGKPLVVDERSSNPDAADQSDMHGHLLRALPET